MANFKKDNRGGLKEATGLRTRKTSIYAPGQNETFKISRSKFANFIEFRDFGPVWLQNHPSRTGKLGAGTRRPYDCRKTERGRNTTTIRALHF